MSLTLLAPNGSEVRNLQNVENILRKALRCASLKVRGYTDETRAGVLFTITNIESAAGRLPSYNMSLEELQGQLDPNTITLSLPENSNQTTVIYHEFCINIPEGMSAEEAIRNILTMTCLGDAKELSARIAEESYTPRHGNLQFKLPISADQSEILIGNGTIPIGDFYAALSDLNYQ